MGYHKWNDIDVINDGKRLRVSKNHRHNVFIDIGPNLIQNMEMNQNKQFLKFLNQNFIQFILRNEEQMKKWYTHDTLNIHLDTMAYL